MHVLTAGHCLYDTDALVPLSQFAIEAGVSNFNHPLPSDVRQIRALSAARVMPGYIPASRTSYANDVPASAHDLAVLTLSRPLDLNGPDARAARLPAANAHEPSHTTRLVLAGFGEEKPGEVPNGSFNQLVKPTIWSLCSTGGTLCLFSTTSGICFGDSGAGLVEPGSHPTVVGVVNKSQTNCLAGLSGYIYLGSPAALRFINASR
jgi:hypothetical protein